MATGPFRSKLNPHYDEIVALRMTEPPTTFVQIAAILKTKHRLAANKTSIIRFLRVRRKLAVIRPAAASVPLRKVRTTTGQVPSEVQARIDAMKSKALPTEEPKPRLSFLPPDGILTFKEKS